MEENSDIFLAGGDALVYLAKPMHKKYSTKFVWRHPFSTYVSHDQFFNYPSPVRTCTHFGWPPPFPQLRTYLMDGLFLNQKKWKIQISYSLKYKDSRKNKFFKNHTRTKILNLISVTLSHITDIIIVPFKTYLSQCL